MKLLLDTHVLLWAAQGSERLSGEARSVIQDEATTPLFSAASIWEVAIKAGMGREDFTLDARMFRRNLIENGYVELPISGLHAAAVAQLPPLHKDPFDRMLIAQAISEGLALLTADAQLAAYPGQIRVI